MKVYYRSVSFIVRYRAAYLAHAVYFWVTYTSYNILPCILVRFVCSMTLPYSLNLRMKLSFSGNLHVMLNLYPFILVRKLPWIVQRLGLEAESFLSSLYLPLSRKLPIHHVAIDVTPRKSCHKSGFRYSHYDDETFLTQRGDLYCRLWASLSFVLSCRANAMLWWIFWFTNSSINLPLPQ